VVITNKAVKAVIFNEKNQVLILKRTPFYKRKGKINVARKYALLDKKNIWDFPGGRLDSGESEKIGLKREVLEETGLKIKIIKKVGTWNFISLANKKIDVVNYLCKVDDLSSLKNISLSEEHETFKWIFIKNIKRYTFKDKSVYDSLI